MNKQQEALIAMLTSKAQMPKDGYCGLHSLTAGVSHALVDAVNCMATERAALIQMLHAQYEAFEALSKATSLLLAKEIKSHNASLIKPDINQNLSVLIISDQVAAHGTKITKDLTTLVAS